MVHTQTYWTDDFQLKMFLIMLRICYKFFKAAKKNNLSDHFHWYFNVKLKHNPYKNLISKILCLNLALKSPNKKINFLWFIWIYIKLNDYQKRFKLNGISLGDSWLDVALKAQIQQIKWISTAFIAISYKRNRFGSILKISAKINGNYISLLF